jgi:hypothetical protein
MTVRIFGPESRTGARVDSHAGTTLPSPTLPTPLTGRQFLQRRARDLQIREAEPLREAVKRWVRAERIERHTSGRLTGTIYHLVPRGASEQYGAAIRAAAETAGLAVVVTGPWPPYAFAEEPW